MLTGCVRETNIIAIRGWIEFKAGRGRKSTPGLPSKMPQSENDVIRECKAKLELLRCHRLLEFRSIHVTYGKNPSDRIKSTQMAGMPDMQIYLSQGVTLNIEYKSTTGKQREVQREWQEHLERLGHAYYIIRSIDDMKRILLRHGIDTTKYTWSTCPTYQE